MEKSVGYKTNINIIAGIPDFNFIFDVLSRYPIERDEVKHTEYKEDLLNHNIRTHKAKLRFLKAIKSVFLTFRSFEHKSVFLNLFKSESLEFLKKATLFFQFAINDRLFFELTNEVFLTLYHSGRLTVDKSEFTAYLYFLRDKKTEIKDWSDSTITITSSKYLTLLKKLDILKGTAKKEFKNITPDDPTIIFFIYLVSAINNSNSNILESRYVPLLMIDKGNLLNRIKKISVDDFFSMSSLGHDLKIDLKYSYEEINYAIAERYQSKI